MDRIAWFIALTLLLVGEAFFSSFLCISFASGALAGLLSTWLPLGLWEQIVIFSLVSSFSLFFLRPLLQDLLHRPTIPTNADRVLGKIGWVTVAIDPIHSQGVVSIDGQMWSAISVDHQVIPAGTTVYVLSIQGVKVLVAPHTTVTGSPEEKKGIE